MVSEMFMFDDMVYRFAIDYSPARGWHNLELVRLADNSRKQIKTRSASGYAIRINKGGVAADGGAWGVFSFLSDCIKNDFMMCYVYKVCDLFA